MSDSLQSIDKRCIFRETFENEQSVRKKGGTPVNVTFSKGAAVFPGVTSYIGYDIPEIHGTFSVRIKCLSFTPEAGYKYFLDQRQYNGQSDALVIYINGGYTLLMYPSGTYYVDGIASQSINANTKDIVVSGISGVNAQKYLYLGSYMDGGYGAKMSLELFEIYSGTLTADEVKNLYENKRYKSLIPNRLQQLGVHLVSQEHWADVGLSWWSAHDICWSGDGTKIICNGGLGELYKSYQLVPGKMYRWKLSVTRVSGSVNFYCGLWPEFCGIYYSANNEVYYPVANSHYIYIYAIYFIGTIDLIEVQEVIALGDAKEILNVSAINGTIRNKYSGEMYGSDFKNVPVQYSSPNMVITGLTDPTHGTYYNLSDTIDPDPRFLNCASALTNSKTYKTYVRAKSSTGSELSYYNGVSAYVSLGILTSSWQVLSFTSVAYANDVIMAFGQGHNVDIQVMSIKEIIPAVIPTDVSVVKENDTRAMMFNGTSAKIDCGSYDALTGNRTFIAWIYLKANMPNYIVSNSKLEFAIEADTYRLLLTCNEWENYAYTPNNTIKLNIPQMVVATKTSTGYVNLYLNGVLSGSAGQFAGTPVAGTTNIIIGDWTTHYFKGLIPEVRIIDGILSAPEIAQLYSSEKKYFNL